MARPKRRKLGSVERLPSGLYRARAFIAGKLTQLGPAVPTEAEAEATLDAYAARHLATPSALTLDGWGLLELQARKKRGIRSHVIEACRWGTRVSNDPIAKLPVKSIKRKDIVEWVARLEAKPISAATIKQALTLLRQVLLSAVDKFGLEYNPARDVKCRKKDAYTKSEFGGVLFPEEQTRLLAIVPEGFKPHVRFALYTGCRVGEQWELKWSDVNLITGTISISRSLGGLQTKSGRVRSFKLPPPVLSDLREMEKTKTCEYIFPGRSGMKYNGKALREWGNWVRAAGITRPWFDEDKAYEKAIDQDRRKAPACAIRWHDLRHTCCTSLLCGWWGRKWTTEEVKTYIGHGTIRITERYAKFSKELLSSAIDDTAWSVD